MSLRITVLILASVSLATAVHAQGKPLPQLSLSHGVPPLTVRTYVFAEPTPIGDAMRSGLRCPMPVFRTPSAIEDPMPVAAGGRSADPMPVVGSGCWNPLFPEY